VGAWRATGTLGAVPERQLPRLPQPRLRRAVVIGAGSFGTAVAVLLARGGTRTTLQARTTCRVVRFDPAELSAEDRGELASRHRREDD